MQKVRRVRQGLEELLVVQVKKAKQVQKVILDQMALRVSQVHQELVIFLQ